ncbi:MAG: rod shape-determining protein MreC [Acidobacteria bacterium]|nr:MAG: rod shape-determining protein MreC [Acidobacteriota bacterium]
METVLGRYRNLIVLAAVLFVQILGLAVQVRRSTENDSSRLIRVWAVGAVSPFEKALVWVQTSVGNVWHNYFYLRGIRAENRELKLEIERMRIEQVRMSQDADQARRLQALLAFKEQFISQTMAAQVIGSSGSEQSRSIYIDKGEKQGIKPDMAVITADGVVGKVLRVYHSTSQVLLIDDQSSGVGAILERSRLQGILRGTPAGEVVLEKVMSDEAVPTGERVLTSGGDRIFPKGLPIGTVTRVSPGSELFLNIRVKPTSDLSKLEEVLVVTKIDDRQATPDQVGPVRASDILAERLPSVPPKPAENAAGTTGAVTPKKNPDGTTPATEATTVKPGTASPSNPGAMNAATAPHKPAWPPPNAGLNAETKPKTVPANATGTSPSAGQVKPAVTTQSGTAVKVSDEPPRPAVQPKPQPPAQDSPQ